MEQTLGHVHWPNFILAVSSLSHFFCQDFGLYNICYIYGQKIVSFRFKELRVKQNLDENNMYGFCNNLPDRSGKAECWNFLRLSPNFSLGFCFKYYSSYYQEHFIFDEAFIILSTAMKPPKFPPNTLPMVDHIADINTLTSITKSPMTSLCGVT